MPDINFVEGLRIETKQSQYGEYMKCSINTEKIFNNPVNNEIWINFYMFKSKNGNWYAKLRDSSEQTQTKTQNIVQFDEDEIPF